MANNNQLPHCAETITNLDPTFWEYFAELDFQHAVRPGNRYTDGAIPIYRSDVSSPKKAQEVGYGNCFSRSMHGFVVYGQHPDLVPALWTTREHMGLAVINPTSGEAAILNSSYTPDPEDRAKLYGTIFVTHSGIAVEQNKAEITVDLPAKTLFHKMLKHAEDDSATFTIFSERLSGTNKFRVTDGPLDIWKFDDSEARQMSVVMGAAAVKLVDFFTGNADLRFSPFRQELRVVLEAVKHNKDKRQFVFQQAQKAA